MSDKKEKEQTGTMDEPRSQETEEQKPKADSNDPVGETEPEPTKVQETTEPGKVEAESKEDPKKVTNKDQATPKEDDKGSSVTVIGPDGAKADEVKEKDTGKPRRTRQFEDRGIEKYWVPRTKLGLMVRDGDLTSMEQVLDSGHILREPEIVDILLGELQDEVIDVNMVQRMTDSGRRVRFAVTVAVGNENGYLGLGRAHGREVGPTIRKAIDIAKLNIFSLKRGCGSWECGCENPHSIPFRTHGKSGSVEVTFMPAPKGVGLAAGDVAKKILKLGGIRDLWATTKGQTQTTINYATAVYTALVNLSKMRINKRQQEKLKIITGGIEK